MGRTYLDGLSVLEIGAGSGLAGIVAALLGASVSITDKAAVVPLLETNAIANAPGRVEAGALRAEALEWGQRLGGRKRRRHQGDTRHPDLILASDVLGCGDAALYPPLLKTLRDLCGPSTSILMAYKPRARFERDFFAAACGASSGGGGPSAEAPKLFAVRRVGRASLPRDGGGGAGGRTESYHAPVDLLELRLAAPAAVGQPERSSEPAAGSEPAPGPLPAGGPPTERGRISLPGRVLSDADFDMYYAGMDRR